MTTEYLLTADGKHSGAVDSWIYAKLAHHFWKFSGRYFCRYERVEGRSKTVYLHKEVLELSGLIIPTGALIDHRNGNKTDCRLENLRIATKRQNNSNVGKRRNNKTGCKGVTQAGYKFAANITVEGKCRYLGRFSDPIEAAKAYDRAALSHFGEFTQTNFPQAS